MVPIDNARCLVGELVLKHADGTDTSIFVRIGLPYHHDDDWWCPCEISGLETRFPDVTGANPIQAFCLALSLVRRMLGTSIKNGSVICLPNSTQEALTVQDVNIMFGVFGASELRVIRDWRKDADNTDDQDEDPE